MGLIDRLKNYILRPLDLLFWTFPIYYFVKGAWIIGIVLVLISILIGFIGQKIDKDKSIKELLNPIENIFDTEENSNDIKPITPEESRQLGKVTIYLTFFILITALILFLYHKANILHLVILSIGIIALNPIIIVLSIIYPITKIKRNLSWSIAFVIFAV